MCKKQVHALDGESDDGYQNTQFVGMVNKTCSEPGTQTEDTEWHVKVWINDQKVTLKIDTGATCNDIPVNPAQQLNIKGIRTTRTKLVSYSGHSIKTVGKKDIAIEYKGKFHVATFNIVRSRFMPVLGLETFVELGLIQRLNAIQTGRDNNEVTNYKHLFSGLGCLPGEYKIKIDENIPAVVHPSRKIPHMLSQQVKQEL
ncbi:uncharacterized protein [Argopecten irradians]|uniref:uncharacterized protein n=1 Tax=Argopecten irradians TaxID=31199 RepID=UPI003713F3F1